jgi:hypothetical protein
VTAVWNVIVSCSLPRAPNSTRKVSAVAADHLAETVSTLKEVILTGRANSLRRKMTGNGEGSHTAVTRKTNIAVAVGIVAGGRAVENVTGGRAVATGGEIVVTGGEAVATGGEAVATGGEAVVTGGEAVATGRRAVVTGGRHTVRETGTETGVTDSRTFVDNILFMYACDFLSHNCLHVLNTQ